MTAAKEATATFDLETRLLTVVKKGTGTGTVTSEPAGINCGATCSASYTHGTPSPGETNAWIHRRGSPPVR